MKKAIVALAIGLMPLGFEVSAQQSAQKSMTPNIGFLGCCVTDAGKWCCAIGTADCKCSVSRAAEIMPALKRGLYEGDSLQEALQEMMKALPTKPDKSGGAN